MRVTDWGNNEQIQLGSGHRNCRQRNAKQPCTLQQAPDRHTLCITVDCSFFSWGVDHRGQLGVGDTKDRHASTLVTVLQGKRVMHVSAGEVHTFCSTTDGSVFTWGSGEYGRLDLGDDESNSLVPTLLQGKQVMQVAAAEPHSACVTKDSSVCTHGGTIVHANWVRRIWMMQIFRCWCRL